VSRKTKGIGHQPQPGKPSKTDGDSTKGGDSRARGVADPRARLAANEQLAGYLADGSRAATLREVTDPAIATKQLGELTHREIAELAVRRLETEQEPFGLRMLGVPGIIDKTRAIAEIRAGSAVGMHLMDIEQRVIRLLIERS
jgi:hypothetical protein